MMFERYTEKARRAIFFARYEASQLGASQIEAEHILLGLLREDGKLAAHYLQLSSVDLEKIRSQIESRSVPRGRVSSNIDMPLSRDAKEALAFAAEEAEMLNHRHIGTEHLLLGLLRKSSTIAFEVLTGLGVRLDTLRDDMKAGRLKKESATKNNIITQRIPAAEGQPEIGESFKYPDKNLSMDERWSQVVLKICTDQGIIILPELTSEFERVAGMRQFPADVEALMRLLAAKGLVDPEHLAAFALQLRDEEKLGEFIEKLKKDSPEP
jgi:ATP-dependent Clp protease ATP-binding subunit ClpC